MADTILVLVIKVNTGGWIPYAASKDSEALKKAAPGIVGRINKEYGYTKLFDEYHVYEIAVIEGGK